MLLMLRVSLLSIWKMDATREKIGKARSLFHSGIHRAVNGYPLIQSAANQLAVIKRLLGDTKYLDAVLPRIFVCSRQRVICTCLCNAASLMNPWPDGRDLNIIPFKR